MIAIKTIKTLGLQKFSMPPNQNSAKNTSKPGRVQWYLGCRLKKLAAELLHLTDAQLKPWICFFSSNCYFSTMIKITVQFTIWARLYIYISWFLNPAMVISCRIWKKRSENSKPSNGSQESDFSHDNFQAKNFHEFSIGSINSHYFPYNRG